MEVNADEIRHQAAESADEIAAAIREGRAGDARGLLPALAQMLAALTGDPMSDREMGIEQARAVLGDLARDAAADGTVTWLTSHRRRIAAIVPARAAGTS